MPQRHTDKAPMLSRTSRQRGEQNGGDGRQVANGQTIILRARVPVGMVHHPAGTSRATGQALAEHSSEVTAKPDPRPVDVGTHVSTPVAALPEGRMQRDKTPNGAPEGATYLLRQVASGASSETSMTTPGGRDPDRRRSMRGPISPPCGGESEIEELARSGPNLRFRKRGAG